MVENSTEKMEFSEDILMLQIDAFKDKARQIQGLVKDKENRVLELEQQVAQKQAEVAEKERQILELQNELAEKQAEADSLVSDVETQVERMMDALKNHMQALEENVQKQVSENHESAAEQASNLKEVIESMTGDLSTIQEGLMEKTHTENVRLYRNIQDLMKEHDVSEASAATQKAEFTAVRKKVTAVTVIAVINLIAVACSIVLNVLGII